MKGCDHLKEFVDVQIKVMNRHIDKHKWFNGIENEEDAMVDFIKKYGWIMREIYCNHVCERKDECELIESLLTNDNYENL